MCGRRLAMIAIVAGSLAVLVSTEIAEGTTARRAALTHLTNRRRAHA